MAIRTSIARTLGGAVLAAALSAQAIAATPAQQQPQLKDTGCAPFVAQKQAEARVDIINSKVAFAKEFFSTLPDGFQKLSCLERLMNGGMDIIFSPPGLGDLLGMLESAICRKADELFDKATAPLNQALDGSLPVGEIIPGVDLGSINGGVRMRARTGNGGMITTNINSVLTGGPTYRRDTIDPSVISGGLFGN